MNNSLRTLTQVVSIINMFYKIALMLFAVCKYEQASDMFKLESFNRKFLYL